MSITIGNIIRDLRCSRNLTQEQLADNLNITAQAISKWENNIGMPDISQVVPLAHFFGVSTDFLFGVSSDKRIDEVKSIINIATSQESYRDEYTILKDALKTYPGDVRLLLELLSCGECLLADGDTVKEPERTSIFDECERAGKLILLYSKDLRILQDTTEWMIKLYCEMGDVGKATALSDSLSSYAGFNKEAALARIYERENKYDKAAECYETNICQFQRQLVHSLILCGHMKAKKENREKAIELYSLAITLCKDFLDNNPVSENKSLHKYLTQSIERCKKTIKYLSK